MSSSHKQLHSLLSWPFRQVRLFCKGRSQGTRLLRRAFLTLRRNWSKGRRRGRHPLHSRGNRSLAYCLLCHMVSKDTGCILHHHVHCCTYHCAKATQVVISLEQSSLNHVLMTLIIRLLGFDLNLSAVKTPNSNAKLVGHLVCFLRLIRDW
jgi:hypothetical protein